MVWRPAIAWRCRPNDGHRAFRSDASNAPRCVVESIRSGRGQDAVRSERKQRIVAHRDSDRSVRAVVTNRIPGRAARATGRDTPLARASRSFRDLDLADLRCLGHRRERARRQHPSERSLRCHDAFSSTKRSGGTRHEVAEANGQAPAGKHAARRKGFVESSPTRDRQGAGHEPLGKRGRDPARAVTTLARRTKSATCSVSRAPRDRCPRFRSSPRQHCRTAFRRVLRRCENVAATSRENNAKSRCAARVPHRPQPRDRRSTFGTGRNPLGKMNIARRRNAPSA